MKQFVGIGYRKDFGEEFLQSEILQPSFIELAPENWMNIGGYWKKVLKRLSEKYPVTAHGLSLSIGSPEGLDWNFLKQVKQFLQDYNVTVYSEHLSYSKCNNAHLYDLLPIPFRHDAVKHIVERIKQVQDFLGRKITMEIVSYYTPVAAEMTEVEFVNEIIKGSDCNLLLDVNNVYVNAFNHNYDAHNFIDQLPLDTVAYIHMAGHEKVSEDLIIDTHGQPIIDPVYKLFEYTVNKLQSPVSVLLERDFNIPEFPELAMEMNELERICKEAWSFEYAS
ncbi:MAG TPA: DUF692 domain-containing protein [Ignavibacteriaceae bacterium]|nr:DUF692 domain-containing protein [Ignavibacteriaceae bacterium]